MSSDDNYLYYSHEKLLAIIKHCGNKNNGIREYLRTVKYAPISDFDKGLEWFNIRKPLSFQQHLKGKIVVLDFFTYCCINCIHIIPDLREIESKFSVEDGLVIIGVHSAKFENEKMSSNILAAIQRYNIAHPVVNDHQSNIWQNCDVHCWPTLLILGPNADPIIMLTGEGHKEDLLDYLPVILDYYKEKNLISNHSLPLSSSYHLLPDLKGPLLFPGKITSYSDNKNDYILAISDTGNNRILIVNNDGEILKTIGGRQLGFKDGSLEKAEFNNPQGLVFHNKDVLFVADTENHAIRRIDLAKQIVETVAGTGEQGHDKIGGNPGPQQLLSSPWDVAIYQTPSMDLTFHADGKPPVKDVLLIAMAGTHQIWALFLDDIVWWKCTKYNKNDCVAIAGTGKEENKNNHYPHAASFAQPSGLALCSKNKELYVADSESSCIRRLSLIDGKVSPVVGGDRNPLNLFAFGDIDGITFEAKLQHPLGVCSNLDERIIYVADTYNHKLKKIDTTENKVTTLQFTGNKDEPVATFKEPAGLCMSPDGKRIYLADTNNHQIKVLTMGRCNITKIEQLELTYQQSEIDTVTSNRITNNKAIIPLSKPINIDSDGGKLILNFKLKFIDGLNLTAEAPQKWLVNLPNPIYSSVPKNGNDIKNLSMVISLPGATTESTTKKAHIENIDVNFNLVTCTAKTCLPKKFLIRVPVLFSPNGKSNANREVNVILNENNIKLID